MPGIQKRSKVVPQPGIGSFIDFGVFDAIGDEMTIQDTSFRILFQNRAHISRVGSHIGEYCYEAYHGNKKVCEDCQLEMAFRGGDAQRAVKKIQSGNEKRYVEITASPIRDAKGVIVAGIEVVRDVTEWKRLESIAQAANLMDNLGYVFSGIRHEIGNPVNAVKLILSAMKVKLRPEETETGNGLDAALEQLSRVEFLLKTLRNFNMFEDVKAAQICLPSFAERFISLLERDFPAKGIEIVTGIEPDVQCAFADERAMQQILLNLASNSADALEGIKNPRIAIRIKKAGDMVIVTVEDNGRGIPKQKMKDLFKPFHTTKASGTGLGLVIVKKMMLQMGGDIKIASEEGRGTTVSLSLPCRGQSGPAPG